VLKAFQLPADRLPPCRNTVPTSFARSGGAECQKGDCGGCKNPYPDLSPGQMGASTTDCRDQGLREEMMTGPEPPFSLVGLDHVVLLVDDMERALGFYQSVLGCMPGYSYPELGMEQVWCGASLIVLWDITHPGAATAVPPVAGGRNVDHICIATSPLDHDKLRTHFLKHEVVIGREAFHGGARGMGHSFYFHDPFGNKIEPKGPAEYQDGRSAS
jgi:glyoxylase I family protein